MRLPIWDLPIRLFHWLLAILIAASWWTAEEEMIDWHYRSGTGILFLLLFRLAWGFLGSSTARFSRFVRGPRAILSYLSGRAPPAIGHNPIGALSVLALLGMTGAMVALGLVSTDEDGLSPAPLSHLVSYEASESANDLHEDGFDVLLVLIGLHIAAILYYLLVKRRNLVGPMVSGGGAAPEGATPMEEAPLWRLLVALLFSAGGVWLVWSV